MALKCLYSSSDRQDQPAAPHKQSNGNKPVLTQWYTREHRLTQKFMSLWGLCSVLVHHSEVLAGVADVIAFATVDVVKLLLMLYLLTVEDHIPQWAMNRTVSRNIYLCF